MPRKTIAPPPVSDIIVPAVKTTKSAAPRQKAASKTIVEPSNPSIAVAPRQKAAPKTIVELPNTFIEQLADAVDSPCVFDAREIEERAYQSWIERGCPMGSSEEDWYRAERELISRFATASR